VPGGFFHDLWILLHNIKCKIASSIGGPWIFPRLVNFSARNLNMTWTDKDLKEKERERRENG